MKQKVRPQEALALRESEASAAKRLPVVEIAIQPYERKGFL